MRFVFFDFFYSLGGAQRSTRALIRALNSTPTNEAIFISPSLSHVDLWCDLHDQTINLIPWRVRSLENINKGITSRLVAVIFYPLIALLLLLFLYRQGAVNVLVCSEKSLVAALVSKLHPKARLIYYVRGWGCQNHFSVLGRMLIKNAVDRVFTVSNASRAQVLGWLGDRYADKVACVYTSVDTAVPIEGPKFRADFSRMRLLFIGSVIPLKGLHLILDALTCLPPHVKRRISFKVAGGSVEAQSEYFRSIELYVSKIQGIDVSLLGTVNDVMGLLDDTDFLIMASESEGFPRVAVEAMARGVPIISTAVGGLEELIGDGKTGCVVASRNVTAIAASLVSAINLTEAEYAGKSKEAVKRIRENYILSEQVAHFLRAVNET